MEIWKVVGYRLVNFTDDNGRAVKGTSLFLAREPVNKNIVGLEVSKLFVGASIDYVPKENEMVEIAFNRYGKVTSVSAV